MLDDNIFLVTSYNCEAYITHCIESILNQTSKNYNVLFIDDCSTDLTVKRIKEYQSVLRNSRLFIGKKRTMSAAWNQAQVVKNVVKNPNSNIMILDADDKLASNDSLQELLRSGLLNHNCGTTAFRDPFNTYSPDKLRKCLCPYHMRFFKAWLYHAVPNEAYYKDGELIKAASDYAFIKAVEDGLNSELPIFGQKLYYWNSNLSHNDHWLRRKEQEENTVYIQSRESYPVWSESDIKKYKSLVIN